MLKYSSVLSRLVRSSVVCVPRIVFLKMQFLKGMHVYVVSVSTVPVIVSMDFFRFGNSGFDDTSHGWSSVKV